MPRRIAPPWSAQQRKIAARNARLARLIRAGKLIPTPKHDERAEIERKVGTTALPDADTTTLPLPAGLPLPSSLHRTR